MVSDNSDFDPKQFNTYDKMKEALDAQGKPKEFKPGEHALYEEKPKPAETKPTLEMLEERKRAAEEELQRGLVEGKPGLQSDSFIPRRSRPLSTYGTGPEKGKDYQNAEATKAGDDVVIKPKEFVFNSPQDPGFPKVSDFFKEQTQKAIAMDDSCYSRAKARGEQTFTLVARDRSSPRVICEWIKENIETCPKEKLVDALLDAIAMRENQKRKAAD